MNGGERYYEVLRTLEANDRLERERATISPLRKFRDRHGLNQAQLGALLGVTECTERRYEKGRAPRTVLLALSALEVMFLPR